MQLQEKILLYRKKNGLSQESLAEKIGVSRQAVSKWETGDALPEIPKLKALADCFGVTVDFLVGDSLDEPPQPSAADTRKYEPVNRSNIFDDALDTVEDRAVPFVKKKAWIGGLVLILIGGVSLVKSALTLFTAFSLPGDFSGLGVPYFSFILLGLFGMVLPIAMVVGGIIIIKKFKK